MTFLCSFRTISLQLSGPSSILARSLATPILSSSFHTSSTVDSRIKWRHTHKPFFFTKKTAKHPDTPVTFANKKFLEEVVNDTYSSSPLRYFYLKFEFKDIKVPMLIISNHPKELDSCTYIANPPRAIPFPWQGCWDLVQLKFQPPSRYRETAITAKFSWKIPKLQRLSEAQSLKNSILFKTPRPGLAW